MPGDRRVPTAGVHLTARRVRDELGGGGVLGGLLSGAGTQARGPLGRSPGSITGSLCGTFVAGCRQDRRTHCVTEKRFRGQWVSLAMALGISRVAAALPGRPASHHGRSPFLPHGRSPFLTQQTVQKTVSFHILNFLKCDFNSVPLNKHYTNSIAEKI